MSDFLTEVAQKTRLRVDMQKGQVSPAHLKQMLKSQGPVVSFRASIYRPGKITLIAELKQASPSAGVIRKVPDITACINSYTRGGAAALSILTEEDYFHGSPQFLEAARKATKLPLLRKDFIIDTYQILESRQLGANAVLLIAALLPGAQLKEFIGVAKETGLDALVEVHTEDEMSHAVQSGATIIGINNRNLHTLKVDTTTAVKLLQKAPKTGIVLVIESGIQNPSELPALRDLGAHTVLVGEALMRAADPEHLVKEFVHACQK